MSRRWGSHPGRRAWLAGRIAALLIVVIAGCLAIVHYSSWGVALTGTDHHQSATSTSRTGVTAAAGQSGSAESSATASTTASGPGGSSPTAGSSGAAHPATPPSVSSHPRSSPVPVLKKSPGSVAPVHFRTLPPSAKLPSSAQCARWVRARPRKENKGANKRFNQTTGQHLGASFFPASDSPLAGKRLAARINGDFTGTTSEILRWAACKWGIDQNIVFAQAAVESWWQQDTLGDWGIDGSACPPGHGLGQDGKAGQCPQSYGILQNRYPYEKASWPGIAKSTAMNADTAYAIWQSCYDGYETWLNNVPHGQPYHAGDAWGCVGRWFAGRWHTAPAQQYVAKVKQYQRERIWLTPDFQQP
jgi:hypothetical protein